MRARVLRHSLSLLAALMLALSVGIAGISCADFDGEPGSTADSAPSEEVITADSLAALQPGERLLIDRTKDTVYKFDWSGGAIDFSRIDLLADNGKTIPMDRWLNSNAQTRKLANSTSQSFRLTKPTAAHQLDQLPRLAREGRIESKNKVQLSYWECWEYLIIIVVCDTFEDEDGNVWEVCLEYVEYGIECVWIDDGGEP